MEAEQLLKYKDKGRTGLANIGNTSYINSCLQCLSHTHELNRLLDSPTYKDRLNDNPDAVILVEWDNLRNMMWSRNCVVAPHGFVNAIQKNAATKNQSLFTGFEQNDMQEFLMFLLESFHKAISKEIEMKIVGHVKNDKDIIAAACYKMMTSMYEKDYSDIITLFYGIHVSTITSLEKTEILSVCAEPFFVLSLSLPDATIKNTTTIYDCFDEFCKKDRLDGDNSWFNEKTYTKQSVDKGIIFWSFPEILIVHLKRWTYTGRKDSRPITIPLENMDLSAYVNGHKQSSFVYDLYGVCNHFGSVSGGHYTANVKTMSGEWYNFNDETVTKLSIESVISENAYCLFFRKKNSK